MSAPVLHPARVPGGSPTPADVLELQQVRADVTVSLLLPTEPHGVVDTDTAARLARLVQLAGRRLLAEVRDVARVDRLVGRLTALVGECSARPVRKGLALYVSEGLARAFTLPVTVRERVVVDPTFATRDLVRSLHRTPLHVMLLLTRTEARLYEGVDGVLIPMAPSRFPLRPDGAGSPAFLRVVDAALGAHLRARPAPLVLAGEESVTGEFLLRSRATTRVAGVVTGVDLTTPLGGLAGLARPVLQRYLRSREHEALYALARTPPWRVASGLDAVWLAAHRGRPEMLVVEEDFFQAARVSDDGSTITRVDDAEAPDVLDDAVDEVIETVLRRGGWVALASPGALAVHGGVALTGRER